MLAAEGHWPWEAATVAWVTAVAIAAGAKPSAQRLDAPPLQ